MMEINFFPVLEAWKSKIKGLAGLDSSLLGFRWLSSLGVPLTFLCLMISFHKDISLIGLEAHSSDLI